MDSSQIMTSVETPEENVVDVEPIESVEDVVLDGGDMVGMAEMGELPVEDWDYQQPRRGEVRTGVILSIRDHEIVVDVGAKRDGVVPQTDLDRLGEEAVAELYVGEEVPVYVLRPEDQDGNLLLSLNMARKEKAWKRAQELADSSKVFEEQVSGFNKGGLVIPVGEIQGFIPASQVPGFPHGLNQEERLNRLSEMVGETLKVKVIEINQRKRRLILSATSAQRQWRKRQREELLEELREGEVRSGVVSSLCNFGAFVDLGGADGLIHISELAWKRVRHPKEVLKVGQEVEVYVLRLDQERKRIGLSLKRLQPEPWAMVEDKYELGQLVEGVVTNVVDFGAFAEIEDGVEGLIHVSELAEGMVNHPRDVVRKGDLLLLRIIRIDARRKRLGLSLKRVLEEEWAEWAAQIAIDEKEESGDEPDVQAEAESDDDIEAEVEETSAEVTEESVEAVDSEEPAASATQAVAQEREVIAPMGDGTSLGAVAKIVETVSVDAEKSTLETEDADPQDVLEADDSEPAEAQTPTDVPETVAEDTVDADEQETAHEAAVEAVEADEPELAVVADEEPAETGDADKADEVTDPEPSVV